MKRRWQVYYKTDSATYRLMSINVPGVSIEGLTEECAGVPVIWKVAYKIGDKRWEQFDQGQMETIAEAKVKAAEAMERLVDRTIKGLQKWRGIA